jgi:hypothetical protein
MALKCRDCMCMVLEHNFLMFLCWGAGGRGQGGMGAGGEGGQWLSTFWYLNTPNKK